MTLVDADRARNMLGGRLIPNMSPMVTVINSGWRLNPSPSYRLPLGRCIHVRLETLETLAIMHFVSSQIVVLTMVSEHIPHLALRLSN